MAASYYYFLHPQERALQQIPKRKNKSTKPLETEVTYVPGSLVSSICYLAARQRLIKSMCKFYKSIPDEDVRGVASSSSLIKWPFPYFRWSEKQQTLNEHWRAPLFPFLNHRFFLSWVINPFTNIPAIERILKLSLPLPLLGCWLNP